MADVIFEGGLAGKSVLDIGCYDGFYTFEAYRPGVHKGSSRPIITYGRTLGVAAVLILHDRSSHRIWRPTTSASRTYFQRHWGPLTSFCSSGSYITFAIHCKF